jgi:hypothetical protein
MKTIQRSVIVGLLVAFVMLTGCEFNKKVSATPEQTPIASGPSAGELRLTQIHAQYAAGGAIQMGDAAFTVQRGAYNAAGDLVFDGVMFALPENQMVTLKTVRFYVTSSDGLGATLSASPDTPWNNVVAAFAVLEPQVDEIAFDPTE